MPNQGSNPRKDQKSGQQGGQKGQQGQQGKSVLEVQAFSWAV